MELLRRQLQALTEQLRRDRKQQHNQHDVVGSATSNGEDYVQFFVHFPKQKQEWHNQNPMIVQPKMPNQNWESRFKIEFLEFDGMGASALTNGFLVGSTPQPMVDRAEGVNEVAT